MSSRSVRWCFVSDEGKTSSTWILFRDKKSNNKYLATKGTEGLMKISFHESGEINMGLTSEAISGLGIPNASRHLLKGHHIPQFTQGWTLATEIWIPKTELRFPSEPISSKTIQVPFHPKANAVGVQIYFKESKEFPCLQIPEHQPIGFIEQLDGGSVWIVAVSADLPWDPEQEFKEKIQEAKDFFDSQKGSKSKLDRDHLWGIDEPTRTIIFLEKAFGIEV